MKPSGYIQTKKELRGITKKLTLFLKNDVTTTMVLKEKRMNFTGILIMILIGMLCGLTMGVVGSSGTMIVVSFLKLIFGFSMYTALGTSLGIDIITSITTTLIYKKHENVNLKASTWMLAAAVIGIQIGSRIAISRPEFELQLIFSFFLFLSGIFLLRGGLSRMDAIRDDVLKRVGLPHFQDLNRKWQNLLSIITGFIIGILGGFQGAGGGLMFLAALIIVLDYSWHKAVGTAVLMMLVTAISGTIAYGMAGAINWWAVIIIGFSSLPINLVASEKSNELPEKLISRMGGGVFILLAILLALPTLIM